MPTTEFLEQKSRGAWLFTRERPVAALIVSCVVLFSLYLRVADYGFYEDDYWAVVPYLKTPVDQLWSNTVKQFETWSQGRPLNHSLPMWFARIGYGLAGVLGIYFLGFLVHSLNAFLFYLLLRRWLDRWSAILAGCLFVLLPADTTRILLVHSAHVHTSLTFLLVGLLLKRTRFGILAYPIAALSLLSYETAFLPFIVFPLFFLGRKNRIGRGLMHLAGCGIALLIVFGVRLYLVDSRASSVVSSPGEMLWRMTSSLWLGPEASLKTLAKAFLEGPHTQNPFAFLFAALVGVLLVALPRFIVEPAGVVDEAANRSQRAQAFFAGLACWVFAYALTLINYPPTQTAGRLTSTHVSAVFGLACAMAAAVAYLRSFRRPTLKIVTTGTAVALVGLLTLYSFRIQSGFAAAWEEEKRFWRQIVDLCPDISPNTRIILLGLEPRQNEFVLSNSWADSLVLKSIFIGRGSPFLFYYEGLANSADIRFENGEVTWKPFFWVDKRETLNLDEVIILRENGEEMTRIKEFQIPGIPFPLHSKPLVSIQPEPYPSPLTNFGQFLLTR